MASIAIIGGGPAGYVAAITAAQQGQDVTIIDPGPLGGTCLNEGCMPTKSLLESAGVYSKLAHAEEYGIVLPSGQIKVDWQAVLNRKNRIVATLVQGIGYLMKKNKIKVVKGTAAFKSANQLQVKAEGMEQDFTADKIIIASGSVPAQLPFAPFDGKWVINSTQAMALQSIPTSLLIIGGGVIGCEFASIYSRMGTKVTIVEMADQLLPGEDKDIAVILHRQLENDGVKVYTSATLKGMDSQRKKATFEQKDHFQEIEADFVLVSIGRIPRVNNLGLEKIGVDFSKRGIVVNDQMETNISSIYACGDVIGGIQLAHVAFHEGTVAALNASGIDAQVNYRAVPRCIYTSPEIASVGLTEMQARNQAGEIRVGEFAFSANGKAFIAGEQIGKVKVVTDKQFGEILGVSIVGSHATELIGQGALMLHGEMTADLLENFIAAHPSLSEAIHEAVLNTVGHAVHA